MERAELEKEWRAKVERVGAKSELRSTEGWARKSFIVKSKDDLRQEVFVMQMITYFRSIFPTESCWLNTYHIQATGPESVRVAAATDARFERLLGCCCGGSAGTRAGPVPLSLIHI